MRRGVLFLLTAGLMACTVGPTYQQPNLTVPDHWQADHAVPADANPIDTETLKNLVETLRRCSVESADRPGALG